MSQRNQRRAERIQKEISILRVLADFGYSVRTDGGDREQQFSCDLHGTGQDNKPSARVYPESASWYCFACDKTRDAVQTVRDRTDQGFTEALAYLEKKYHLPPLPFEDGDREDTRPRPLRDVDFRPPKSFEDERKRLSKMLDNITTDKSLPMQRILIYWEALDKVVYLHTEDMVKEQRGMDLLVGMRGKLRAEVLGDRA